mmetsp:Transcript_37638/g.87716  ORF Transcript_37638/g.87716 Transcript_37638/m.87716 type:complete len:91 (+) Transcript_37638:246-518(+)
MVIKEKLVFNVHTMRLIGFAHDAFDLDIIKKEMSQQCDSDGNDKAPPLAKHFLVFIFTNHEVKNCPKFSCIAARYSTVFPDANFLREKNY